VTSAESTSKRDLSIGVSDSEAGTVVCLSGRVSVDSSPALREQLLELLKRPSPTALTIDMADLAYLDFSGIATLIEALRIARRRNTKLQLRGLHDGPRHLLEVAGLLPLFDTDDQKNDPFPSEVQ
jgi:anti-sigma B factor antagonist